MNSRASACKNDNMQNDDLEMKNYQKSKRDLRHLSRAVFCYTFFYFLFFMSLFFYAFLYSLFLQYANEISIN